MSLVFSGDQLLAPVYIGYNGGADAGNLGFALKIPADMLVTADPTAEQTAIIEALDPEGWRNFVFK